MKLVIFDTEITFLLIAGVGDDLGPKDDLGSEDDLGPEEDSLTGLNLGPGLCRYVVRELVWLGEFMVNWKYFFDNSSTCDSLVDFAEGKSLHKAFSDISWPWEVVVQLDVIRRMKVSVARKYAKAAIKRWR